MEIGLSIYTGAHIVVGVGRCDEMSEVYMSLDMRTTNGDHGACVSSER